MTTTKCWQQKGWQEQSDDNNMDDSIGGWLAWFFTVPYLDDNEDGIKCDDNDKYDNNKEDNNRVLATKRVTKLQWWQQWWVIMGDLVA